MTDNAKKESSTVGGSIKVVQGPASEEKPDDKKNFSSPFGDDDELLEQALMLAQAEGINLSEIVRKQGNSWVVYDDETGTRQLASFDSRLAAWKRQRQIRGTSGKKSKKKKSSHKAPKAVLAPKAKIAPGAKVESKQQLKNIITSLIKENNSMISYVFEQTPLSDRTLTWDKFINKLPKEVVLSDPGFKEILMKIATTEVQVLKGSIKTITDVLQKSGGFVVKQKNIEQDKETGDVRLNFSVHLPENKREIVFSVKIESGKPLILFSEESRIALNSVSDHESKLLRAELMHIQETVFDQIDDVLRVMNERDDYLSDIEDQITAFLGDCNLLQVAILKYLIKQNYKGVK
jgi:hypothetical protein